MEWSSVCRVCMQTSSRLLSVFTTCEYSPGAARPISDILVECTATQVGQNDALPKNICKKCQAKLCAAYNFKVLCEESYRYLLSVVEADKEKQVKREYDSDQQCNDSTAIDEYLEEATFEDKKEIKSELEVKDHSLKPVAKEIIIKTDDDFFPMNEFGSDFFYEAGLKIKCFNKTKEEIIKKKKKQCRRKKSQTVSEKDGWMCNVCAKVFRYQHMLRNHERSHYSGKNYHCQICDKYYTSEKLHKKSHLSSTKFTCDICNNTFPTKQKISNHLQTHDRTRLKAFKCDVASCDKSFITHNGLMRHRLVHEGVKNYLCDLCSKSFLDKIGLTSHIETHVKLKKFKCGFCPKSFLRKTYWKAHEARHTSNIRYNCKICEKTLSSKTHLKRHMATHSRDMKYSCKCCTKRFLRADNMRRHEAVIHGLGANTTDVESSINESSETCDKIKATFQN